MNIILATLVLTGIPLYRLFGHMERGQIAAALADAAQILTFVLLMRAI